jgi:multidrug efflux pump subunit AcrB
LLLKTRGRPAHPEQFANLVVKKGPGGRLVRLKDVARFELGAARPDGFAELNAKPVVILGIYPAAQARAREVSDALRHKLGRLRGEVPRGVAAGIAFDFTANLEALGRRTTPEYLLLDADLPAEVSPVRTREVLRRCEELLRGVEGVQDVLALSENPFDLPRQQTSILVCLAPPVKRQAGREQLTRTIRTRLEEVKGMTVRVRDLSGPGGFPRCGYPVNLAVHGPEADRVRELARKLAGRLRETKKLIDVWVDPDSTPRPQIHLDIDGDKARRLGVSVSDINSTLQVYLGPLYVNDFNKFGRTWQVVVQADTAVRKQAEDLKQLKVRNNNGDMVPLGTIVSVRQVEGPVAIDRLDGRPMVEITANPSAGVSLAQARTLCEGLAEEVRKELCLPAEYRLTWLQEMPAPK